jgi:LysM repeat protein
VAQTLREFGLEAEAHDQLTWDDLRIEIDAGRPVIVWIIGQMWSGKSVKYEAPDGSSSIVAPFEHTMLLVGYSPGSVQVVDAYTGQYQTYKLSTFLNSWAVLGNMAVFSSRDAPSSNDPAPAEHGDAYTVQKGDYLVMLADRFGTTWQELVELNSIPYPYTIFPGQVLTLPVDEQPSGASQESEPTPHLETQTLQVRLPMVFRSYAMQNVPPTSVTLSNNSSGESVIIQRIDTVFNFARSHGFNWHQLVKLNDLHPPYVLFPGQELKLK